MGAECFLVGTRVYCFLANAFEAEDEQRKIQEEVERLQRAQQECEACGPSTQH